MSIEMLEPANEYVIVVDESGTSLGVEPRAKAHRSPGILHRAFSVFIFDEWGRLLIQKRSNQKLTFAGLWSNSCCSHPRLREAIADAGRRRLQEELGLDAVLMEVGTFLYRAEDQITGLVEYEFDHVLVGHSHEQEPDHHTDDVADWRWIESQALNNLDGSGFAFTPWFLAAWQIARPFSLIGGASARKDPRRLDS